ncbi:hypothetical protein VNI00_006858 [Paramarasmius palmivorus]|uniref:Dihydrolipoamide acetyltransferase component of pyruvate dehydrogenase complex n=1 Tax=Paramarasmius palmivorus TaxID=297713 RepID=A0AAW0D886_9AGAR
MLTPRPRIFLRHLHVHLHTRTLHQSALRLGKIHKFKLADIGEGITECEVIRWSATPSTPLTAFDPLCEVQSDKASVEITSPFDGVLKEILVKEGEVAKVGEGLCLIEVEDEAVVDEGEVKKTEQQPQQTQPEQTQQQQQPTQQQQETRRKHPLDPSAPTPTSTREVLAAPSTRHYARSLGVDIALLAPGSGRDGRVEKGDVDKFVAGATAKEAGKGKQEVGKEGVKAGQGEEVVVELGRTRYGMWKAMQKSLEVPHFGYSTSFDLTRLHGMLPTLNASIPQYYLPSSQQQQKPMMVNPSAVFPAPTIGVPETSRFDKLTYLPFLLKTLSKAMMEWPLFRSSITPGTTGKPTLTIRPQADIAIALSTPSGLYTPTIQAANTQSMYGIAAQLKHLSHLGRQTPCGLTPKEMPKKGGTLTVSNVGAIGKGEYASPVLVEGGGVGIVALGRGRWVWDVEEGEGSGERRLKMGISWSADHRVVEGAELAAFVECWRSYVEKPEVLIGDAV